MGNLRTLYCSRAPPRGYTLIEIAIVLVIVGIILVAVLRGEALIDQARVSDLVQITRDLANATREFKNRYHYLPGDLPNASADLNFTGPCEIPRSLVTSGDGLINTPTEIECVLPHLFFAGYIESVERLPGPPFMQITKHTDAGILGIRVVATTDDDSNFDTVAGYPPTPTIQHIVEFSNVPLQMAQDLDRKLDDGDLNEGNVQGDVDPPVDPVAFLAVPLQR